MVVFLVQLQMLMEHLTIASCCRSHCETSPIFAQILSQCSDVEEVQRKSYACNGPHCSFSPQVIICH